MCVCEREKAIDAAGTKERDEIRSSAKERENKRETDATKERGRRLVFERVTYTIHARVTKERCLQLC